MRKISALIIISLLHVVTIEYTESQKLVEKGIKAGISNSTFDVKLEGNPRNCFTMGGFLKYDLNDFFSIQPELLFTMKGFKCYDVLSTGGETTRVFYELDYLELPILLRINSGKIHRSVVYCFSGPAFALKLHSKEKIEVTEGLYNEAYTIIKDPDRINLIDFGMIIGVGIDIQFNNVKLFIEPRVNHGLMNIYNSEVGRFWRNLVFSLMAGLSF